MINPPSGLVMSTNSDPFRAMVGPGAPRREDYSTTHGIETRMNNRALRSHELFGQDESITRAEFFRYKFDRKYSRKSEMFTKAILPLLDKYTPVSEREVRALTILRNWDGETDENSVGACLANLIYAPIVAHLYKPYGTAAPKPEETFKDAVEFLMEIFGHIDVPLGRVQRLRRGRTDLPIGGGEDTLNSVHTVEKDGRRVGTAGDSYILIAEFSKAGVESWALHQ